jgi:hypothetical protein
MGSSNPWPDPKLPLPGLGFPTSMAPMTLPERRRRWGGIVGLTLLSFAGGVLAGPTLTKETSVLIGRATAMLGMRPPQPVEKHKPTPPSIVPIPAPGAAPAESPAVAARPAVAAVDTKAGSEPAARAATKGEASAARAAVAPATEQPKIAMAEPRAERASHKKAAGKNHGASESAGGRKPAPIDEEPTAPTKNEPAPKPAASKPSGSVDDLMADLVADGGGKNKKRDNKNLDDLLKDVGQQRDRRPEPAPKREAATAATLSAADISAAMSVVKTRGNECAQRLGQAGIAQLKLTVGKDGRVSDVRVSGKVANTPLGQCIEKAARAAAFPPSAGLRFDYRIDAH